MVVIGALLALSLAFGSNGVAGVMAIVLVIVSMVGTLAFLARYMSLSAVVMLEDRGAYASIGRASSLAAGSVWRSVGLLFVFFVISAVFAVVALVVASLVIHERTAAGPIAGLLAMPIYPALAAMIVVLYYDLRIRKEGYDIELMDRRLDGASTAMAAELPAS
jgi:hypothetical protein